MDLIDAFNKASVGELVGHMHPTDPLAGDILFQKTSDINLKAFITGVARNAAVTDLVLGDNLWYAKKIFVLNADQVISCVLSSHQLDDGINTSFDMQFSCILPNVDYARYQADIVSPVSAIHLTCIAE